MADITLPDSIYGPGGAANFNAIGIGGNPYPYGECTWFVYQYYHDLQSVDIPGNLGNATDWVNSAHHNQWVVDNSPVPGKAVSWSAAKYPPFGHVAVVSQLNGDGSFDVLEMNFTYYASDRPELAGKIDQRTVRDQAGIQGFITPTGVTASTGNSNSDLLAAISQPFTSVGDAIKQAGLFLQAEAMTAEHKLQSMAAVGLGTVMAGGGVVLGGLTLAGRGDPSRGLNRAKKGLKRTRRRIVGPSGNSPIGRRSYGTAEQQWLSRQALKDIYGEAARSNGLNPDEVSEVRKASIRR